MSVKIQAAFEPISHKMNDLFNELNKISFEELNKPIEEGKWSILQHLEHLFLSEEASLAYINKKSQFPETLKVVGEKGDEAIQAIRMYMDNPNPQMTVKAPDWVTPKQDEYTLVEIEKKWRKLRVDMQTKMESLGEEMMLMDLYRHPFAGKMNLYQALQFVEIHFNHHLKAIKKIVDL